MARRSVLTMVARGSLARAGGRWIVLLMVAMAVLPACKSGMPWQQRSNQPVAEPVDPLAAKDTKEPYQAQVIESPGLALSPEQRFKDIPLPIGLKEDLDRTFVYQSSTLEVGRMVYSSRASVYDLAQFFLKECPTAGWKLRNVLEAEGKTLVFTKSGKELEIVVLPLGVTVGRRVSITLRPAAEGGL